VKEVPQLVAEHAALLYINETKREQERAANALQEDRIAAKGRVLNERQAFQARKAEIAQLALPPGFSIQQLTMQQPQQLTMQQQQQLTLQQQQLTMPQQQQQQAMQQQHAPTIMN